jgi:hypothetical protein
MPNFISADQLEVARVQNLQPLHRCDTIDCHTEDPEDLAREPLWTESLAVSGQAFVRKVTKMHSTCSIAASCYGPTPVVCHTTAGYVYAHD